MASINFPVSRAVRDMTMTVTVTGLRAWKWRVTCGLWLIGVACRVIGCGFKVELGGEMRRLDGIDSDPDDDEDTDHVLDETASLIG